MASKVPDLSECRVLSIQSWVCVFVLSKYVDPELILIFAFRCAMDMLVHNVVYVLVVISW